MPVSKSLTRAGYVQGFVEFVQHEITELVPLVLLWLIAPGNPHITSCKLTQANQPPLHLVVLCWQTLDSLINARVQGFLAGRDVDQFLSFFESLQYAEDIAVVLSEGRLPPR